ncbi:metallophosphoesterase [Silvimonas iriomotensis]|uniref:Ser/threonine protein phosphatase n=1 Tax=Silvimonas iriomotensis TaxID=449662 RepID=A0ABQ2P5K4_9NEIS|nr:metallophosphoesterase [Silvimonas iriomotensis]GGP18520.1 ser/threonine protein phosphatase [Silvimonas iriomotensis]
MRRRLLFASSVVALLHLYIGLRILPALPFDSAVITAGVIWLVISTLLLPLGLVARGISSQPLSDRLAWTGLLAMGLFSSLFVLTLLREPVLLVGYLALPAAGFATLKSSSAMAVPVLALLASVIGFANARRRARVVQVDVPLENLPAALNGFTIVQISDIHVGPTIKRRYLDAIVNKVNALQPDVIAVTGDLVDGSVADLAAHTAPLARLQARYGAYFVTGNHEYYSGADEWTDELRRLGLHVLMNEHVVLDHGGAPLVLAGVTDYTAHHFNAAQRSDPQAALAGAPDNAGARVLLAHQPRSAIAADEAGFDLQLSGHTHGGQFWPWNLFVRFQQPFTAGLNRLNRLWVYTSRGTGYWGPPKRFGAPSEITRVRLVPAS